MRESTVEKKLVQAVRARRGICWKLTSPGTVGVPDRLVLLPGSATAYVEVKASGKTPRPAQVLRADQLRALGAKVFVLDHPSQIEGVLDEIQSA